MAEQTKFDVHRKAYKLARGDVDVFVAQMQDELTRVVDHNRAQAEAEAHNEEE